MVNALLLLKKSYGIRQWQNLSFEQSKLCEKIPSFARNYIKVDRDETKIQLDDLV